MAAPVLTHEQAKSFYDRFGAKQDLQRFYEDPAVEVLLAHSRFEQAHAVAELGCGTGRLAVRLLRGRLPADATYAGFDISETMVDLARARIQPWADRATVERTDGSPNLPVRDGACDRFLATYVLDLLSEDEIRSLLREARRVLAPGGLLCLASMTFGETVPSRVTSRFWKTIHSLSPRLTGGCRPVDLAAFARSDWRTVHREVVCKYGICTEVLVAR